MESTPLRSAAAMARTASWRCSSLAVANEADAALAATAIVDIRGYIDRHGRPFLLEVCNHGSRFAHVPPAAVELVNPKHRNERKTHMALITSYHVPGLYVEDHSIDVPLTGAAWSRCSWPSAAP